MRGRIETICPIVLITVEIIISPDALWEMVSELGKFHAEVPLLQEGFAEFLFSHTAMKVAVRSDHCGRIRISAISASVPHPNAKHEPRAHGGHVPILHSARVHVLDCGHAGLAHPIHLHALHSRHLIGRHAIHLHALHMSHAAHSHIGPWRTGYGSMAGISAVIPARGAKVPRPYLPRDCGCAKMVHAISWCG
jgi:hypothetical protein